MTLSPRSFSQRDAERETPSSSLPSPFQPDQVLLHAVGSLLKPGAPSMRGFFLVWIPLDNHRPSLPGSPTGLAASPCTLQP